MAESCLNPAEEVPDIIRYFGKRKKIHLIHFRNIVGRRNRFQEVYPDNGDMNMHRLMTVLKEVEYPHMIVPDHFPGHPDDPQRYQAAAFAFGYIKAMIQAVNEST
jgi:mannonate dehydratase